MSYSGNTGHIHSPQPQPAAHYYAATPPAPPPKPGSSLQQQSQGPPLPPPPPGAYSQNELSELDGNSNQSYAYQHHSQPHLPSTPTIEPNWLPSILKDKTTSDLHALLADSELQSALLANTSTTHPALPASQISLQPLIDSNVHLSTSLLALETRLAHQRDATQSRLLNLRALEQQHRAKLGETEDAVSSFSPMALYQRLAGSVQEQEALMRGVEDSWLDGEQGIASEREVGEFVKRVKEAKKTAFLRKERKERWDEGRVGGWR